MKQLFKNLLFFFLHIFFPTLGEKASILMYHSISSSPAFLAVSPENFAKQLKYLKNKNFEIIKLSVLIRKIKNQEKINNCVCLTFDDGYLDNFQQAFPILKKYNFPVTIFLPTGYIAKSYQTSQGFSMPVLGLEEIKEMIASGLIEFMPHTVNHNQLDGLSIELFDQEIRDSRLEIEKLTNNQADILAYPKGKYNQQVVNYLKLNSWSGAVTVREGLVSLKSNIFELPRNSIDKMTSYIQFKGKLSQTIELYNKLKNV